MRLKSIILFSMLILVGITTPVFAQTDSESSVSVTVSADKTSYLFDEVAVIQGSVSEEVFIMKPTFIPEKILINISGNSFEKAITLYPNSNLEFEVTQNLQKVLGIIGGQYTVSVTYGDVTSQTIFSVGSEIIQNEIDDKQSISIKTDKLQYLPGSYVKITATSDFVSPLEGMYYEVHNPNDQIIFSGTLFRVNDIFSTDVFLNTVHPRYGTYQVMGNYSDQTAVTTFELVEDMKEEKLISIWTDKEIYGLGETVSISGRLNNFWVPSLNIDITQIRNLALGDSSGFANKTSDVVNLNGDGSFNYSFKIPENTGLGDYVINISKDIGTAKKSFIVSENPDDVISDYPLSVSSDKESYSFGDKIILSGKIRNPVDSSSFDTPSVFLQIFDDSGKSLNMIGFNQGDRDPDNRQINVDEIFTIVPDSSGRFTFELPVVSNQFELGMYVAKIKYAGLSTSLSFSVTAPIDSSKMILNLEKDIYGLNEPVTLSGITPAMGEPSVFITLTKPDGNTSHFTTISDNQKFSWTWMTPVAEKPLIKKSLDSRTFTPTHLGIYKLDVNVGNSNDELFFKVSLNPETDSISGSSLFVSSAKSLYHAGEKLHVIGSVLSSSINNENIFGPERIYLKITDSVFPYKIIFESAVYPKPDGSFQSFFELPATIFSTGSYKIKAMYYGSITESIFSVSNDFVFGIDDDLILDISTDKSEYFPGDTVYITGKPNKMIFLSTFDVSVIKESDTKSICGLLLCGLPQGLTASILPSPSASFDYRFLINNSNSSLGTYEIMVDADFETKSLQFSVVPPPKLDTVIEKETRISEKNLSILTEEKLFQDTSIAPRVLSGSLITPLRDDQSNVNLKVSTEFGLCIIGSDENCLVHDSTRSQGQIYETVIIDDMSFNVRYSGPDVRLEKFSILPTSSDDFLPDSNWNIDVIKDEQISRLYYKVTYKTLE